jgi:hypothetical protein
MDLPKEVAEHYELVGWKGGPVQVFGRFGVVDINKLTLRHARNLVNRGFKKLKAKPPSKAKPAHEPGSGDQNMDR